MSPPGPLRSARDQPVPRNPPKDFPAGPPADVLMVRRGPPWSGPDQPDRTNTTATTHGRPSTGMSTGQPGPSPPAPRQMIGQRQVRQWAPCAGRGSGLAKSGLLNGRTGVMGGDAE